MTVKSSFAILGYLLLVVSKPIAVAQSSPTSFVEDRQADKTLCVSLEGPRDGQNLEFYSSTEPGTESAVRVFKNGLEDTASVKVIGRTFTFAPSKAPRGGDDLRGCWIVRSASRQDSPLPASEVIQPSKDYTVSKQLLRDLFESEASRASIAVPVELRHPTKSASQGELASLRMLDQALRSKAREYAVWKRSHENKRDQQSVTPDALADYDLPTIYSELDDSDALVRAADRSASHSLVFSGRTIDLEPLPESLKMLARTLRVNARREADSP